MGFKPEEYKKVKEEHKALASKIRELKNERKGARNGWVPDLKHTQFEYRHRQIAFLLLRGKSYEQIETPRRMYTEGGKRGGGEPLVVDGKAVFQNPADFDYIEKLKKEYSVRIVEPELEELDVDELVAQPENATVKA